MGVDVGDTRLEGLVAASGIDQAATRKLLGIG